MLLLDVARQFENQSEPLNREWQEERHVTEVELHQTSLFIGLVLRGAAHATSRQIGVLLAEGALGEEAATHAAPPFIP